MAELNEVEQLEKEVEELYEQTYSVNEEDAEKENEEEVEEEKVKEEEETETQEDNQETEIQEETTEETEQETTSTTSTDTSDNWEQRYKDLQAYATKVAQQNAELIRQSELTKDSVVKDAENKELEKKQDALKAFTAEYPELAELILPVLESVVEDKVQPVQGVVQDITQQNLSRDQIDFNKNIQDSIPDVMDIIQSQDFAQWMQVNTLLPSNVKVQLFTSPEVRDATSLVGQYKLRDDRVKKNKTNKTAEQAADTEVDVKATTQSTFAKTKNDSPNGFTAEEIGKMSLEEFAKNEAAIDKQIAAGGLII